MLQIPHEKPHGAGFHPGCLVRGRCFIGKCGDDGKGRDENDQGSGDKMGRNRQGCPEMGFRLRTNPTSPDWQFDSSSYTKAGLCFKPMRVMQAPLIFGMTFGNLGRQREHRLTES